MGTSEMSKDIQERKEESNLEDIPVCGLKGALQACSLVENKHQLVQKQEEKELKGSFGF